MNLLVPTAVTYTPDNTIFANPERGFYKYTECEVGTGTGSLNESTVRSWRINDNITLIYRIYYMRNFREAAAYGKCTYRYR